MYGLGYKFCSRCYEWIPSRIAWRKYAGLSIREVNNCPFCGTRLRSNPRTGRERRGRRSGVRRVISWGIENLNPSY